MYCRPSSLVSTRIAINATFLQEHQAPVYCIDYDKDNGEDDSAVMVGPGDNMEVIQMQLAECVRFVLT